MLRLCPPGLEACSRLRGLLDAPGRIPEDLLLQAVAGLLEEVEAQARREGLEDLATAASEARRDVEWALRGSGW